MAGIHRESRQEAYDVIVVGAGIGGLSAAVLLAKAGKSVLVVERHNRPGGYAHGFSRRQYRFDAGVHLVSGCGEQGYRRGSVIWKISRALDIPAEATFLPITNYARAWYPDCEVHLHSGEDAFVAGLAERFPAERDHIRALTRLCRDLTEEIMVADEVLEQARGQRLSPMTALAHLFRYRRSTLAGVLDEHFQDERLKSVYASLWPYLGLPPSRLSFLVWATMMAGYTYEGGYYCRGTFQNYANLLAAGLEKQGGELLLNSSVRQIGVESGRVTGVVLENGQAIRADAVISNADARQTAELLIGEKHLPDGYKEHLDRLSPSTSVFVVYLATDLDLSGLSHAHESFFFEDFDHDANFEGAGRGHSSWFSATIPTLTDSGLAPPGQHILMLTALTPFEVGASWRQAKQGFQQRLLEKAERHFPGLNDHLLLVESGSPRTLERYTLNHRGSAYGWAPTPDQVGPNRPDVKGPLPGLYHAGHWTRPGGGIAGVSISGMLAAQSVLGIQRQEDFWKQLGVSSD